MIRYPYDDDAVEKATAELDKKWRQKATMRTSRFARLGRYEESTAIWSKVKPIFMKLQHNKCVFCEQALEGGLYGPVTWDLEHFRPKSNVAAWPDPDKHPEITYHEHLGLGSDVGYYWLAYELRNYAASCKICNSIFKLNFFPIGADRAAPECAVEELRTEEAFLCYPLGEIDDDPEEIVTFMLTTAVPKHKSGRQALRGRIIIDFFGLNKRDHLHRERARIIGAAGALLQERDLGVANAKTLAALERLQEPHIPHAACMRSFLRLWEKDPLTARRGYEVCRLYAFDSTTAPPRL